MEMAPLLGIRDRSAGLVEWRHLSLILPAYCPEIEVNVPPEIISTPTFSNHTTTTTTILALALGAFSGAPAAGRILISGAGVPFWGPKMPLILDSPSQSSTSSVTAEIDPNEERRRLHHDADVVIIGAGILGSALAVALADQGRSVMLLEKSLKEPDRIVGELLQPGGVQALQDLGLRHCLEGIDAVKVKGYGVSYYNELVHIPYPANAVTPPDPSAGTDISEKETPPLKAEGRSFHHGHFVANLRAAAMTHANITVFETEATSLITSPVASQIIGVECLTRKTDKDFFFADLTIVCDGYASKFRKSLSTHQPAARSKFWGMELIDCPLPYPEHGLVCLTDNAPVLFYQIGTHETRVLVDVPDHLASASPSSGGIKSHLQNVVLPSLPSMTQPSFLAALEKGQLRSMPNSVLPPTINRHAGVALLGDALNMRHPLTGGGMTVALNDVVLLKTLLSPASIPDLSNTKLVRKAFRSFHWRRKNLTAVINILAQALYSLFAANDPQLKYLQKGCFRYFQLGGNCIDGPVGLLGGIIRQPLVLVYHFFAVAMLAIWIMVRENGVALLPYSFVVGGMVFVKACRVLFPWVWNEFKR
jgi:squalene monooxygenase